MLTRTCPLRARPVSSHLLPQLGGQSLLRPRWEMRPWELSTVEVKQPQGHTQPPEQRSASCPRGQILGACGFGGGLWAATRLGPRSTKRLPQPADRGARLRLMNFIQGAGGLGEVNGERGDTCNTLNNTDLRKPFLRETVGPAWATGCVLALHRGGQEGKCGVKQAAAKSLRCSLPWSSSPGSHRAGRTQARGGSSRDATTECRCPRRGQCGPFHRGAAGLQGCGRGPCRCTRVCVCAHVCVRVFMCVCSMHHSFLERWLRR